MKVLAQNLDFPSNTALLNACVAQNCLTAAIWQHVAVKSDQVLLVLWGQLALPDNVPLLREFFLVKPAFQHLLGAINIASLHTVVT